MNASQRRIARRSLFRTLTEMGINPGATVERTPPKKAAPTAAVLVGVSTKPRHVTVRTRDHRVREWPLSQCTLARADGYKLHMGV